MTTQDDLDQLLWDYVFGLLEPAEARALEARITSEHDVARAYAEVRQRADLLAAAARYETAPVALVPPTEDVAQTGAAVATAPLAGYRAITWFLASAALALVALLGYTWQRHGWLQQPETLARAEREMAADYRHIVVTGPAAVRPALTNLFTVQLQDLNGTATEDRFQYAFTGNDGRVLQQDHATVDASGVGQVKIDGTAITSGARLEVWCPTTPSSEKVQLNVARAEPAAQTYLACDNGVYRPGDVMFFRSVTLPTSLAQEHGSDSLHYKMLGPDGSTVAMTSGMTNEGVGTGAIALDMAAPAGRYKLQLENPASKAPGQVVEFDVKQLAVDAWRTQLVVAGDTFTPGQKVQAELEATTAEGIPLADADVDFGASFNGQPLAINDVTKTNEQGKAGVTFRLPDREAGQADVLVKLSKGEKQVTLSRSLIVREPAAQIAPAIPPADRAPADHGVALQFYPDGGALVAGLENDVLFEALDDQQQPIAINGTIVDSQRNTVAEVSTAHNGRGRFTLTPERHERYFIELDGESEPQLQARAATPLPAVAAEPTSKLTPTKPVLAAGQPVELAIASTKKSAQLLVAATNGEAIVGQQVVNLARSHDGTAPTFERLALPIADDAAGVLQVTLFDLESSPPRAISQRQFYRLPAKFLSVSLASSSSSAATGADWTVRVQDEQDRGCAAVLGVNVVAEHAQPVAAPASSLVASWYAPQQMAALNNAMRPGQHLLGDINNLHSLDFALATGGADFETFGFGSRFGSGGGGSGGQGPASFGGSSFQPGNAWADDPTSLQGMISTYDGRARTTGKTSGVSIPAVADNFTQAQAAYKQALTTWRENQQERLHTFAFAICTISFALLFAVALVMTLRIAGRPFGWLSAMGAATAALIIAGMWLGVHIEGPIDIAVHPVAHHDGKPLEVALAGSTTGEYLAHTAQPSGLGYGNHAAPLNAPALSPLARQPAESPSPAPVADNAWSLERKESGGSFPSRYARLAPTPDNFHWYWREILQPAETFNLAPASGPAPVPFAGLSPVVQRPQPAATFLSLVDNRFDDLASTNEVASGANIASGTLYWNPRLETNDQGEAHFRFAAPAGVRYRILIDAHGAGRVGSLDHWVDPPPDVNLPAEK